ncbi:MAG: hypothetical protein JSR46_05940 [Verrucomicrobia bacterium]|nr:hypothetical protein [Verrucomicrobiota bacterium]
MKFDIHLHNAAVIGENGNNPDVAFVVDGQRLHAVEQFIADQKKDKSAKALVLPLMRDALKSLQQFALRNVPEPYTDVGQKGISLKEGEKEQLIEKIKNIYIHLSHQDRNDLSSLIHHKT